MTSRSQHRPHRSGRLPSRFWPSVVAAMLALAAATIPLDALWVASAGDPLGCHVAPYPTPAFSVCADWIDETSGRSQAQCCVRAEDLGSRQPPTLALGCTAPRAVSTPRPAPDLELLVAIAADPPRPESTDSWRKRAIGPSNSDRRDLVSWPEPP